MGPTNQSRGTLPGETRDMTTIREMHPADAPTVARIHASAITTGFLARLGPRFLACLYRGIAEDTGSRVWVAQGDTRIIGFCAYSVDVGAMYRRVLRRRLLPLAWASLPRSLNPFVLKEILDTCRYPAKQEAEELPAAEILSIAVDLSCRATGTGRKLLEQAMKQAATDGVPEIKVLAGADLLAANRFYIACGFEKRAQIIQHGHPLNVYVRSSRPSQCG